MNKSSPLTSVIIWAGGYVVRPLHLARPFDRRNIPYLLRTCASQFVAGSAPHPERRVVYARWSTLFQHGPELLESHISRTMDRTRWTGGLASSLTGLQPTGLFLLGAHEIFIVRDGLWTRLKIS
ncbi:hypothetical protein AVEN_195086-1 [Araneus ventricosus]|uniref:Uncharacterized protein n=1 Tax=Araneus ventricosus TaxID=182803 RepID=A0A4Y2BGV1_ARAVE|nr:hypothetical protein AVEN_195086-1 [Araneus ventricosus]